MEIKVKYHASIDKIRKISIGDWIDLRCAEDTFIPVGDSCAIPLGVSMELPEGYEAHILPRSSTFMRYGILPVNGTGIIDSTYRGDGDIWHFLALCFSGIDIVNGERGTLIPKNARICQFRIVPKQPEVKIIEVNNLGNDNRGGLGSTGI